MAAKKKYPRGGAKQKEANAEAETAGEAESEAQAGEGAEADESGAGRAEPAGAVAPAIEKPRKEAERLAVTASEPVDGKIQVGHPLRPALVDSARAYGPPSCYFWGFCCALQQDSKALA